MVVLDEMLAQGRIDQATHDAAVAEHVWLAVNGDAPDPPPSCFPPEAAQTAQPWFSQYVKDWLELHLPLVLGNCPCSTKAA